MKNSIPAVFMASLMFAWTGAALSQDAPDATQDEATVRQAVESYVKAFNARDAKALAEHWSPQAVYTSRTSGEQLVGREAIAKEFTEMFAGENLPTLAVATDSIEFISPNVALERGTAVVTHHDETTSETTYSVVYVKHDNKWLVDRVTEDDVVVEDSNYDQLKGLEFLIGSWVDAGDGVRIRSNCQWTKNQNYISRTYRVTEDGEVTSSGLQIIGWDAAEEQIRSWLFDSSGTFVKGTWSQNKGNWINTSVATLADGASGSFTAVFRPIDDNSYGWQKINRIIGGQLMPNVNEVIVERE